MKSLSYILLAFLLIATYGCKEEDHPYVGYLVVERAIIDPSGGSVTLTANTDISEPIQLIGIEGKDANWCSVSINDKQITVTANEANPNKDEFRTVTVNIKCGYRVTTFSVLQKYDGQEYWEHNSNTWTATGSDVQENDGGGYPSLFTEDRTKFWHSQYNPAWDPAEPHVLTIDMKQELSVAMVRIGRRVYGESNYGTVKKMEIYTSPDGKTFTQVGGFTFELPWTAPDGTIVTGTSPLIPPYEEVTFTPTTARFVRLRITETNNTTGICQVAYFKAFEKI